MLIRVSGFLFLLGLAACSKQQYILPEESLQLGQRVTYNNQVDVLLVVDNSPSMSLYQDRLADQAASLIVELNRLGMDYQIASISTDMRAGENGGRFIGEPKILRADTPNLVSLLQSKIRLGNSGSDLERGFESMARVFSPAYQSGDGRGFIRDGALLAVIALSSENDWSTTSVATMKTTLDTLKPPFNETTSAWVLNFIGVPSLASSCSSSTDGGYREPGLKWIELVNISGGVVEPICDTNLGKAAANVRKRIVEIMTDFPLGRRPLIETIRITINGKQIPQSTTNGWEYLAEGHIIRFHGNAVPGADDIVYIDYKPAEAK